MSEIEERAAVVSESKDIVLCAGDDDIEEPPEVLRHWVRIHFGKKF